MRLTSSATGAKKPANRSRANAAAGESSDLLSKRILQLNASVRREPHMAAGVIQHWLVKGNN